MKQIILIRHAKVDIDYQTKLDSASLKQWLEAYDSTNIEAESRPAQEAVAMAKSSDVMLTSTLRRSVDSARLLNAEIYESNDLFNEAKIAEIKIPFLKLKPKSWLALLRVLSLFGLGNKESSLQASKRQAENAAKRLLELSSTHDRVVLVGHGGMNWLIRKVLLKEGWHLGPNASSENWGLSVLKLEDMKG